jgi:hypothetical protein
LGGSLIASVSTLLVSCCVSIIIYLTSINNSNRILIAIIAALVLTLLLRFLYNLIIHPILAKLPRLRIITILLISALVSLVLILTISMDHQFPAPLNEGYLLRLILFPTVFAIPSLIAGFYGPAPTHQH